MILNPHSLGTAHVDPIQMSNLYLRVTGQGNIFRNGQSHYSRQKISIRVATGIPMRYQGANITLTMRRVMRIL